MAAAQSGRSVVEGCQALSALVIWVTPKKDDQAWLAAATDHAVASAATVMSTLAGGPSTEVLGAFPPYVALSSAA